MKQAIEKLEKLIEFGGIKKDIVLLMISGIALVISIFKLLPMPFDAAWWQSSSAVFPLYWKQ